MSSTHYVHKISQTELCELLEVDERGLLKLSRRGLPTPIDSDSEGTWWSIPAIRDWLTTTKYRRPRSLLVEWWPDAPTPADLVRTQLVRDHGIGEPMAVLQHWHTDTGSIVVTWAVGGWSLPNGQEVAGWAPGADAYLVIGLGWGIYGPDVWAYTGARPDTERDDIEWHDLARVLGRPAPFWPDRLRHPDLILEWEPGSPLVRHAGVLDVDVAPLMRMALLYPPDHVVHRAMVHTAKTISNRGDAEKSGDLTILAERLADGRINDQHIVLAADAAPNHTVDMPSVDGTVTRAGWREVLYRNDRLAEQCVRIVREWDGGRLWPYAHIITVPRHTAAAQEFLDRLEPAARTAVYYAIDKDRSTRPMVDPATDIPVAVPTDEREIRALAPQRLPTTSPLAELILEHPIWVRTEDGVLYPAPLDRHNGLSWGYGGSGPAALAALTHALLADITANGAHVDRATDGLYELFRRDWPAGTVLNRAQLEAARDA